jgi:hypothetical protein
MFVPALLIALYLRHLRVVWGRSWVLPVPVLARGLALGSSGGVIGNLRGCLPVVALPGVRLPW